MAPPSTSRLKTLEQDLSEAIGTIQTLQQQVMALEAKVSAILRQDINAMNGYVLNGEAQPPRPF